MRPKTSLSVESVTSLSHPDDWVAQHESSHPQRILYNPLTFQYIQQYLFLTPQSLSPQTMQYYEYRKHQNHNWVTVVFLQQKEQYCRVWTEYIPLRLNDIKALDLETSLVILKEASIGFQWIVRLYGLVRVDQNNIGFNWRGRVKVWLSSYFQYNHDPLMSTKETLVKERNMVRKLVCLVTQRSTSTCGVLKEVTQEAQTFQQLHHCVDRHFQTQQGRRTNFVRLQQLGNMDNEMRLLDGSVQGQQKQQDQSLDKINLSQLARAAMSYEESPLRRNKTLSMIQIPQEYTSTSHSKVPTPVASKNSDINPKLLYFSRSKSKNVNKRCTTEPGAENHQRQAVRLDDSLNKNTGNSQQGIKEYLVFEKQKKFATEFIKQTNQIGVQKYNQGSLLLGFTSSKDRETKKVSNNPEAGPSETRRNKNKSFCFENKPRVATHRPQVSELVFGGSNRPLFCFTQRPQRSTNKLQSKPQKGSVSASKRVQSVFKPVLNHIRTQSHFRTDSQAATPIEAQFQEFLKDSQSKVGSKINKAVPLLQFSRKPKTSKPAPAHPSKKYEYSTFYEQEINMRTKTTQASNGTVHPGSKTDRNPRQHTLNR